MAPVWMWVCEWYETLNNAVAHIKLSFRVWLLGYSLLLLLAGTAVVAQEPNRAMQTSGSADEQAATDTTAVEGLGDPAQESIEESEPQKKFEPTEEISEDLSIPFPVDI